MSSLIQTRSPARLYRLLGASLVSVVAAFGGAGCASMRPDPFAVRVSDMGYMVKMDETYRRIPIAAGDKAWFDAQLRSLFEHQKTRGQFVSEGEARYPGYQASWQKLADLFGS